MQLKKIMVLTFIAAFFAPALHAWNPVFTASYVRMPSRYATVNSPDAALYNPAGLVKLEDGLYVELGDSLVYRKNGFNPLYAGASFVWNSADTRMDFLFPSALLVYRAESWASFITLSEPGNSGAIAFADDFLLGGPYKVERRRYDVTLGLAYAINKYVSLAAGLRSHAAYAFIETAGLAPQKYDGFGFAVQAGVDITPLENLNIGILYVSRGLWVKNAQDYEGRQVFYAPDTISLGIGYDPLENLNVQAGFSVSLDAFAPEPVSGVKYKNAMDFSLGAEYRLVKPFTVSAGLGYLLSRGTRGSAATVEGIAEPDLDAFLFGFGFAFTPLENLTLSAGYLLPVFFKTKASFPLIGDVELTKELHVFSLSVSYRFL